MIKRIVVSVSLFLGVCLCGVAIASAQSTPFELTKVRSGKESTRIDVGTARASFSYARLEIPSESLVSIKQKALVDSYMALAINVPGHMYAKKELVGGQMYINDASGLPAELRFVVVDVEAGELLGEKLIKNVKPGMNEVLLDKPITVNANKAYYVGYVVPFIKGRSSEYFTFDYGMPTVDESSMTILSINEISDWSRFTPLNRSLGGAKIGAAVIYALFKDEEGSLANLARISHIDMPRYGFAGETFSAKLSIENHGSSTITAAAVSIKVGDQDEVVQDFSQLNIPPGRSYQLLIEELMEPAVGRCAVAFSPVAINGKKNAMAAVSTEEIEIRDGEDYVEAKTILFERMLAESCKACPEGEEGERNSVDKLVEQGYEVSRIAHHVAEGSMRDWLVREESEQIAEQLEVTTIPALAINRSPLGVGGALSLDPTDTDASVSAALRLLQEGTPVEIAGVRQAYTEEDRKLALQVDGLAHGAADLDDIYLHVIITESDIEARDQIGKDGAIIPGYLHDDVVRVFVTGVYGEKMTADGAGKFSFDVEDIDIPTEAKVENLKMVVFVSRDFAANDKNRRGVYGSKTLAFGENYDPSSNTDTEVAPDLRVTSFRGSISIHGDYKAATVYNLSGVEVPLTNLAAGIYIVRIDTEQGVVVRKVSVSE